MKNRQALVGLIDHAYIGRRSTGPLVGTKKLPLCQFSAIPATSSPVLELFEDLGGGWPTASQSTSAEPWVAG